MALALALSIVLAIVVATLSFAWCLAAIIAWVTDGGDRTLVQVIRDQIKYVRRLRIY